MKNFKFTLQALLTLREREEQTALHDYGRSLRHLEEVRRKLEQAQEELAEAYAKMEQGVLSGGPAVQLAQLQAFCAAVKKKHGECEYTVRVAQNKSQQAF